VTGAGHGNTAQQNAEIALRRSVVAEEYRKKKTTRQIAEMLGCAHATVVRDVKAIIAERRKQAQIDIEDALANEIAGQNASEANLLAIAEDEEQTPATRIAAEAALVRVRGERAKLQGLYAAQRVELTGKDGGPISVSDYRSELASVLAKVIAARGDRPLPGQLEPEGAEAPGDGLGDPLSEGQPAPT
jgi:hypothetical protein